jgi:hypothetical protein
MNAGRPVTTSLAATAARASLAPYGLLRTAGLPGAVLDGLSCSRAGQLARDLDQVEAELAGANERLCEELHGLIHGLADDRRRHQLLALKRAVFKSRPCGDLIQALASSPEGLARARDLMVHSRRIERRADLLRRGEAALDEDWRSMTQALAAVWRDAGFRTGVLFAQSHLYGELDQAFGGAGGGETAPSPQSQLTILAYALRMATKTSPFSSFSPVGVLAPGGGDEAGEPPRLCNAVALDVGIFEPLDRLLRAWPAVAEQLPLFPARLARIADGAAIALSPVARTATSGPTERLASVALTDSVELLLTLVADQPGHYGRADLGAWLADRTGVDAARWTEMIETLEAAGLVESTLGYGLGEADALARLIAATPWPEAGPADQARGALQAARDAVAAMAQGAPETQARALVDLRRELAAAVTALGGEAASLPAASRLVRHACHLRTDWRPPEALLARIGSTLGEVAGLIPLMIADGGARRMLDDTIRDRFAGLDGGVDILTAFEAFRAAETGLDPEAPEPAAMILRRDFLTALRRAASAPGAGPVELPQGFLRSWSDAASALARPDQRASAAFMGLLIDDPVHGAGFVLEQAAPGQGALMAAHADPEVHGAFAQALAAQLASLDADAEVVDLIGVFGFTGQTRPNLTARRLVHPAEPARRDDPGAIDWADLVVAWDAGRGAAVLRSRRDGRRILPVHTGSVSPIYFTPFYNFIALFGPPFALSFDITQEIGIEAPPLAAGEVRHYRRLTRGDVVLLRETWSLAASLVPPADSRQSPFEAFIALRDWARGLGLPRRVFVRPMSKRDYLTKDRPAGRFSRMRKPFYVDWDDAACHRLFRRFTRDADTALSIAEALPAPHQWPVGPFGDRRPLELVLEAWEPEQGHV